MMEEEVISFDNIVNNKGTKRPQMEGEWVKTKYWTRDNRRGRPGEKGTVLIRTFTYRNKCYIF